MSRNTSKKTINSKTSWLEATKSKPNAFGSSHPSSLNSEPRASEVRATLKCIKFSPRLKTRPDPKIMLLEFEQKVWTDTMESMGALEKARIPPTPVYDAIATNPYHCIPKGREFDAKFGVQNQWRPIELPPIKRHAPNRCNCIHRQQLPLYKPLPKADQFKPQYVGHTQPPEYYIPASAVRAIYVDHQGFDLSFSDLCSLLMIHGAVFFTMVEGVNSMIAVYQSLRDAAKAVRYDAYPRGLSVSYVDKRLYNMGHFVTIQNYTVAKDEIWNSGIRRRFGIQTMNPFSARSNTSVISGEKKPVVFIKLDKDSNSSDSGDRQMKSGARGSED